MATHKLLLGTPGSDHRPPVRIDGLTTSGTDGTRNTVAHGLGYTPKAAIAQIVATDADGALTSGHVAIVSMDATNVVTRGSESSITYNLIVFP